MAKTSLQDESAQANPLTLWDAGMKLEDLELDAAELASLIFAVSRDGDLDGEAHNALRAIGKLAVSLVASLTDLREAVYAAHLAGRGDNVSDFPGRG